MSDKNPVGITDVVLRDAHQSLFATRLRLDDMLPIAEKLDQVGFSSLESWGHFEALHVLSVNDLMYFEHHRSPHGVKIVAQTVVPGEDQVGAV